MDCPLEHHEPASLYPRVEQMVLPIKFEVSSHTMVGFLLHLMYVYFIYQKINKQMNISHTPNFVLYSTLLYSTVLSMKIRSTLQS